MKSRLLLNLLAHMRWADQLVAETLEGADRVDADAERLYAHVAAVEELWYSRIVGLPTEHAVWPPLSAHESRDLAARYATLYDELVTGADDTALARVVHYRNSAGRAYQNTVEEIVTHVAMHGSYHRGQIARQLRGADVPPPYTDYIQFMRRDQ